MEDHSRYRDDEDRGRYGGRSRGGPRGSEMPERDKDGLYGGGQRGGRSRYEEEEDRDAPRRWRGDEGRLGDEERRSH